MIPGDDTSLPRPVRNRDIIANGSILVQVVPGASNFTVSYGSNIIWNHNRDCYRDCGCAHRFIDFPAFYAVCNIALPCALDSAAINLLNRCMPATKNDKYLPVD